MKLLQRTSGLIFLAWLSAFAIIPNQRVSVGQTLNADPLSNILNDGKFGRSWTFSSGSWAAIQLSDPSSAQVMLSWNSSSGNWSDQIPGACNSNLAVPTKYNILISDNSTDGEDGTWDTVAQVSNNAVGGRNHVFELNNADWVKMEILEGSGLMDEIELFEADNGLEDSWFFMGTSITMMTYKSTVPDSNFADIIHGVLPNHTPAMVRGGVGCINSGNVVSALSTYLDNIEGVHYVAIEMGTNDAWGGNTYNISNYANNMQKIIDSVKARGMEPVLARPPATDSVRAEWQLNIGFVDVVDSLTELNDLIAGPDLYNWFLLHPDELSSDGVHPTATGAQSIIRLWAQAMLNNAYEEDQTPVWPKSAGTYKQSSLLWDGLGRICRENCATIRLNTEKTLIPGN